MIFKLGDLIAINTPHFVPQPEAQRAQTLSEEQEQSVLLAIRKRSPSIVTLTYKSEERFDTNSTFLVTSSSLPNTGYDLSGIRWPPTGNFRELMFKADNVTRLMGWDETVD